MTDRSYVRLPKGLLAELSRELGVDLIELQRTGMVSPEAVARMNSHCSACTESAKCHAFTSLNAGAMAEPPPYCANRKLLMYLRKYHLDVVWS